MLLRAASSQRQAVSHTRPVPSPKLTDPNTLVEVPKEGTQRALPLLYPTYTYTQIQALFPEMLQQDCSFTNRQQRSQVHDSHEILHPSPFYFLLRLINFTAHLDQPLLNVSSPPTLPTSGNPLLGQPCSVTELGHQSLLTALPIVLRH